MPTHCASDIDAFMDTLFSRISIFHLNTLLVLGLALFGGTVGGRLLQKMKIPQVVGYILMGLLLGQSGFKVIDAPMIHALEPFNYLALGLIGFMIGGELKKDILSNYGKQFIAVLLCESSLAMVMVTVLIGTVGTVLLGDPALAWALGLILGAISAATAPAATTDVLWETKAKGPLTTMVFGIVALDDVLALAFFAVATSLATRMLGITHQNVWMALLHPVYEVGGALALGGISGLVLIWILKRYNQKERMLAFLIGMVMLVLGIATAVKVSMILAAMILGMMVVNGLPQQSRLAFEILEGFTPPIFVLFFVFIGAKVTLQAINPVLLVLIVLYVVGRTVGKMTGAYLGARGSGASDVVRKYVPLCLFSQAGVSIGLSIAVGQIVSDEVGSMVVIIITASTFLVQMIGPPAVKYAVTKAKEVGRNITEDDILQMYRVADIMDKEYPVVAEGVPVHHVLNIFSTSPYTQYPVVDGEGRLKGVINIESIKHSLQLVDSGALLIADDIKSPFKHAIAVKETLFNAKAYMDRCRLGFLPVVNTEGVILGCFDRRMYQKFMSTQLLALT